MSATTDLRRPTILTCGMVVALISFLFPSNGASGEIECIDRWYEQCLESEDECAEQRCELYCDIYDCAQDWADCADDPQYCPRTERPTYDACACADDHS